MDYDQSVALLRAIAEPTRLRMTLLCAQGELSVGELTQILGQSQPRVSRHLKLLSESQVLVRFAEGAQSFYALTADVQIRRLVEQARELIDRDDVMLARDAEQVAALRERRFQRGQQIFADRAQNWNELEALGIDHKAVQQRLVQYLPDGPVNLLDAGLGTGEQLLHLAQYIDAGTGLDINSNMLAVARSQVAKAQYTHLTVISGNLYQLPVPDRAHNVVLMHMVMHFLDRPRQALLEVARVLEPGGRLIIVDFAPHHLESLKAELAHQWLGFADAQIDQFVSGAGLHLVASETVAIDPLTVKIWHCSKP
ncbi:MAG: metalloregulator ArsR/SmtB family transcription factor [Gammaproteobacteria bacterium]|nr:metalloregulator ArsR/SmtB family transcription factor [Gammaproteobacteria bacterium]